MLAVKSQLEMVVEEDQVDARCGSDDLVGTGHALAGPALVGQDHGLGLALELEPVEDALLLHQAADEGQVALVVLDPVLAGRVAAAERPLWVVSRPNFVGGYQFLLSNEKQPFGQDGCCQISAGSGHKRLRHTINLV